jgi:hypothetical protein
MSRFSHREANPPVILVHAALMAGLFTVMSSSTALAQATQPAKPTVAPDLTGLFTAPPTKVYKLSEGRTMTAAQIRAALDAQIAGKLKGPFLSARRTLSVKVIDPSQLARESAEIMAETKAAARQSANSPPAAHPVGAPAGRAPELHQESGRPVPPAGAPTARASELSQESARPVPPAGAPAGRAPTNNPPPGPSGATTTIGGDASAKAGTPQQPCAERSLCRDLQRNDYTGRSHRPYWSMFRHLGRDTDLRDQLKFPYQASTGLDGHRHCRDHPGRHNRPDRSSG